MPMLFIIHLSDMPERTNSLTIPVISSMEWVPLALLCRMVEAILLDMSLSITATGSSPFSLSYMRLDVFMTM